ncbi:hypothetical protein, partial [Acinetobacter baumannii]|uniref:hypothetical protein n=1 Tax=Acinetobacter baumannii TaxID=470 RepID=UPI001BB2BA94
RAREGRLVRADSCVSVCQPSLVLPPSFDSDRVELPLHTRSPHMRTISSLSLATFAKIFDSIPNWSLRRFNRL